ncbi:MAG: hypothetical protein WBM11_10560 [Terriglobales bacterium]
MGQKLEAVKAGTLGDSGKSVAEFAAEVRGSFMTGNYHHDDVDAMTIAVLVPMSLPTNPASIFMPVYDFLTLV